MIEMILKMSLATSVYVLLTVLIRRLTRNTPHPFLRKVAIGLLFGGCSVLSTHIAVDYKDMVLNVRDLGPLSAGLFFDPFSGILAGLIGGIERYIAGTYWGIGSYTRIACSLSTCLAGFVSASLHKWLFKKKIPSTAYAFIMGAVMEVFHMYVVFVTHRENMDMALYVVKICSGPMIIFTGLGLAVSSTLLKALSGENVNPFRRPGREKVPLSQKFQLWLFIVTMAMLLVNLVFSAFIRTQISVQNARNTLTNSIADIREEYQAVRPDVHLLNSAFHVGSEGSYDVIRIDGTVVAGTHVDGGVEEEARGLLKSAPRNSFFSSGIFGTESLARMETLDRDLILLVQLPQSEVYADLEVQIYETVFADIILFAVIYVLISQLVQLIVVNNLVMVNDSLARITDGNLDEVVNVRTTSEFTSLSDDINLTVDTLKGYIEAAEKRIEQELEFARTIQDSSLPKNFSFPRNEFELYALMDPAREVGGDFYDFFFVDQHKLALVIADVSGKGIPAALFMMRAKTAIRSLAESGEMPEEILRRANNALCEGNDAEMFVTVWLGIIDLRSGLMKCANAGHEYPALMRAGAEYELLKDAHGLALAGISDMRYKPYDLQLHPGDRLFVYTDGVPEAINQQVEAYGTSRMVSALNTLKDVSMAEMLPAVRKDITAFTGGADQFDDITMLGFAYFGV